MTKNYYFVQDLSKFHPTVGHLFEHYAHCFLINENSNIVDKKIVFEVYAKTAFNGIVQYSIYSNSPKFLEDTLIKLKSTTIDKKIYEKAFEQVENEYASKLTLKIKENTFIRKLNECKKVPIIELDKLPISDYYHHFKSKEPAYIPGEITAKSYKISVINSKNRELIESIQRFIFNNTSYYSFEINYDENSFMFQSVYEIEIQDLKKDILNNILHIGNNAKIEITEQNKVKVFDSY